MGLWQLAEAMIMVLKQLLPTFGRPDITAKLPRDNMSLFCMVSTFTSDGGGLDRSNRRDSMSFNDSLSSINYCFTVDGKGNKLILIKTNLEILIL